MSKSIVITSGKGGVGKTTCTSNIGAAIAMIGHSVVLIDADIGLRNLDVVMGLENRIIYTIMDVAEQRCDLSKALVRDRRYANLYLLPAAQINTKDDISPQQMQNICVKLKEKFDYVLIDCPAGIEQGYRNSVAAADDAIVVTTPEVAAIRDADRVIGLLNSNGIYKPKLILNKIRNDMVRNGDMMTPSDVSEILGIEILGVLFDDKRVVISTNRGETVIHFKHNETSKEFMRIAAGICGNTCKSVNKDKRGLHMLIDKISGKIANTLNAGNRGQI